ncbi:MAG: hypothetical protein AB7O31_12640 [Burkholderiales bacterium]
MNLPGRFVTWLCAALAVVCACSSGVSAPVQAESPELKRYDELNVRILRAEERALASYFRGTESDAIRDLSALASLLKEMLSLKDLAESSRMATHYDAVLTFGRLAKTYRLSNRASQEMEAVRQALEHSTQSGRAIRGEPELRELVDSVDRNYRLK